jgi:phage recombination protein Bet
MSDEKQIAKYEYDTDHGPVRLTPETVRKYLVSGQGHVNDQEVMMFLTLCKYQRLNPFLREAYLIKYSDGDPATIVVGKDVHVKRAAKHPQFDGIESGVVVEREGAVIERAGSLTLSGDKIIGGWAVGHRKDWNTPRKITVSFDEYVGKKKDGSPNRSWAKMPGTMMVKVAEAQCLRAMFPEELQALYNAEEMGGDYSELSQKPIPTGDNKTADEIKRQTYQLLEDNGALLGDQYKEGVSGEMELAGADITILANIYDDVCAEIRSLSLKETREQTKKGFADAAAQAKKYGEEPPLPDGKPDDSEIGDKDEKDLELF